MKFISKVIVVAAVLFLSANATAQNVEVEVTLPSGPLIHGQQSVVVVHNKTEDVIHVDITEPQNLLGLPTQYTVAPDEMAQVNFTPSSVMVFDTTTISVSGPHSFNGGQPGVSQSYDVVFGGDTDENGIVNFADFLTLSDNFGQPGGWADGDFDGDGFVGFSDFLILSTNFGNSL